MPSRWPDSPSPNSERVTMRPDPAAAPVRIDKWLWAARFFKTRAMAQHAVDNGRVLVAGERVKVARLLKGGERLDIRQGELRYEVVVQGLSSVRGPAPVARTLYQETPASVAAREAAAERRRFEREPAASLQGRPSKRDRRDMARIRWD